MEKKNFFAPLSLGLGATRRAACVLLVMMLTTATAWAWSGDGSSGNPFLINSANDLAQLATDVNGGTNYNNMYFKQTANITLTSAWAPIGTYSHPFKGHYDGGGFTISGLTVTGNYQYAGLFGYITSDYVHGSRVPTELKDINIVNCNIDVSSAGQGNGKAGGIAGYVNCFNMSNCKVSGTIKGYNYAAGLIGEADAFCTMNGCFADVTVNAHKADPNAQYPPAYCLIGQYLNNMSASDNYYHDKGGVPVGITATPLYMVTGAPSGVTLAATNATLTYNAKHYFAAGSTASLTVDDANKILRTFSVSGTGASVGSVAANKKSATVTVGTADVTVSATLQTVSGTTADGLTWSLTQDNSGNYTVLTISGTGAMQNYGHTTVGGLWRTTAPWGYGLTSVTIGNGVTSIGNFAFIGCQSLATVTIGNSVATIGENAFDHCDAMTSVTLPASVTSLNQGAFKNCVGLQRIDIQHDGAVSLASNVFQNDNALQYIVFPSIAAEQANTTGNWSGFASKLRVALGSYLFTVTDEGGTAAYEIANETDLRNLSAAVNQNHQGCNGLTFCQTAPITLNGTFTPIGYFNDSSDKQDFYGTYDGGGYTISGLSVSSSQAYAGLFGAVQNGGMVKNVRLISPSVTCNFYGSCVGALIGLADQCTIENCSVVSPIVSATASSYANNVGALVGDLGKANVQNCFVVSPTLSAAGSTKVGAICGYAYSASKNFYCTLTNVYYYNSSLEAIGEHVNPEFSKVTNCARARKVTAGDGVTVSPAASDPANGFVYNNESYYREGLELTLGNTLGEAPEYYALNYATTAGTINGSTLTVGNADATVSAAIRSDGQPHSITYMKADGTTGQADAIALDGYETAIEDFGSYCVHLADGTYYVGHDISYDYEIYLDGDITLILGNGKTMTLASNVTGIYRGTKDLTIYGQSLDPATAGTLRYDGTWSKGIYVYNYTQHSGNVTLTSTYSANKAYAYALEANTVTLNGGKLTITANSTNVEAINASMTVTGGQLDATATGTNAVGINASSGDITLGWTRADDYIHVSSYKVNQSGTVKIADGQSLYNGSEVLSGTITDMSKLDGKTLRPYKTITLADAADNSSAIREWNGSVAEVTLTGRTLYKDGDWNTLCLPFDVSTTSGPLAGDNVVAMTLNTAESNLTGSKLTLNFDAAETIPAGTPFIIKWGEQEGKTGYLGTIIENPVFTGVTIDNTMRNANFTGGTFKGTYSPIVWDTENKSILFVGTNNTLYWPTAGGHVNACRAYFDLGSASAREFVMNFEEGNSETTSLPQPLQKEGSQADAWYTLDGRKLNGKPITKGLYIHNGKKVIIK